MGALRMRKWPMSAATLAIITAVMVAAANPVEAKAETGWNENSTGWWWEEADGNYPVSAWKQIGGSWYYFDANGYMTTGWQQVNGTWYYMNSSGAMTTGWQQINGNWYYMNASGAMTTGWQQVNGNWYYMYSSGAMASNTYIGDYYVNADGVWETGKAVSTGQWKQNSTGWWWENADGSYPVSAWKQIGGSWYYFDANGYMTTGWQQINGNWYYMDASGAMMTDTYVGDYYVGADGAMTEHIHNWVEVKETVSVKMTDEFQNPIVEDHDVCAHCGYDYTAHGEQADDYSHTCPDGTTSSWGNRGVIVGYETVPAIYVDEEVVTGYQCSTCGATKSK